MTNDPSGLSRRTVLKGLAAGSAACVLGDLGAGAAQGAGKGGSKLSRSNPEGVGVDPAAVLAFVEGVDQKLGGLHSFMLLRHGQVAAEGWWAPYAPQHPHMLFSLSKSFTSTAVGLAVEQGLLKVDALVTSFFPEELPAKIDDHLKAMQVRHLLTMSTGHDKDALGPTTSARDGNWVRAFLALPVEHEPGSKFVYNSAATYMLSAIVQKLTGVTVLEYLKPRLFGPLGIEGPTWETCPRGINTGGWGLSIKTEDIARFGQLYLQRGKWHDRRIVPEGWIAEATSKQVSNGDPKTPSDWAQGYGYQFWRCRHGAFRGDGAFGQFCVVMPEQDAVLAVTSGLGDMQAVLNLAWEHLLPGMAGAGASPAGPDALKRKLAALQLPAPEGKPTSPIAARASGKTFRFEANDRKLVSATPTFGEDGRCAVLVRDETGERRIQCGRREWTHGGGLTDEKGAKVAGRGAWTSDDTYSMKLCLYETPFVQTLTWKFDGDVVTLKQKTNVGFGPTERPPLTGRAQ